MMDGSAYAPDIATDIAPGADFRVTDTVLFRGELAGPAVRRVARAADGRLYVVSTLDDVMEAVAVTRADVAILDMPQYGPHTAMALYHLRRRFPTLGIVFLFDPRSWLDPNWEVDANMAFVDRRRFRMPL